MKHLLVTGGSGFIGTNFVRYLLMDSDFSGRVVNVDKLTYAGNPENLADMAKRFSGRYVFVKADIGDRDAMARVFRDYDIDAVCHFAAESHVDRSIKGPAAFIQTNIVGTFNLLELARDHQDRLELFHHISTDEVFGSLGEDGFFTEETSYKPNSPYSASKAASDHLVRAYHKTYGLPITVSNCSNNYGPFQFPEKLLPLVILNALEGKPLPVYGDGKHVRDWLYVEDHCRAIWTIMKEGTRGETYNVGGNREMENIAMVEMICDILDDREGLKDGRSRRELISFVKDRPGHDRRYAIDCSKLRQALGWTPRESLETGIVKTIDWYVHNQGWVNRVRSGEYQAWMAEQYG
ncbi:MAG: dTDP-glucose 4,6-dehydratase [Thermodesulfobacteriota bacterium]|nr:dTDP-glucose 4,6-dehydratase [Thermodesulfobacteriota bacterium]